MAGDGAGDKVTDDRVPGSEHASQLGQMDQCLCPEIARTGLGRGQTVAIEYRWAEGRPERYGDIAAKFVRRKVSVIVTVGTAVLAAKHATSTIPIVFGIAVDPVGSGLVASLARPGGNVTGLSVQSTELAGKRVEILRGLLPDLHQLAVIADVGYSGSMIEIREVQASAKKIGLEVDVLEVQRAEDIVRRSVH
jgi:putative tryptophan/tyrosine transport system substrate-binding protein